MLKLLNPMAEVIAQKTKPNCLGCLSKLETRDHDPFSQNWYNFPDKASKRGHLLTFLSSFPARPLGIRGTLICNTETTPWISPSTANSQRSLWRYKSLRQLLLRDALVVTYLLRQKCIWFHLFCALSLANHITSQCNLRPCWDHLHYFHLICTITGLFLEQ